MAHYAIIGIAKLKNAGSIKGALDHMTRSRYTPNSNGKPNDVLVKPPKLKDLMDDIALYRPRKNAVLCYDMLLTASPDYFIGKTEQQIQDWERKSLEWVCKKFPPGAVKACIAHRDELTPHLSLLVTPEDNAGKLNARYYTGGRAKMRQLWTEYASAMRPLGLERGREFSPAQHQSIKEYYEAVQKGAELAKERVIKAEELPSPEIMDRLDPRQYATDLINRAISFIRKENGALRAELERERRKREEIINRAVGRETLYQELEEKPERLQELRDALAAEKEARAEDRKKFDALATAIKTFFRQNIARKSVLRHPDKLGALLNFPEIRDSIRISIAPDEKERRGMERGR